MEISNKNQGLTRLSMTNETIGSLNYKYTIYISANQQEMQSTQSNVTLENGIVAEIYILSQSIFLFVIFSNMIYHLELTPKRYEMNEYLLKLIVCFYLLKYIS
jgi:hypothetical protein